MSACGYPRNTTPNLAQWARQGVQYKLAAASAPWTYPSHSCFFTGQWPFKLNSQWNFQLDTLDPTLAEFLTARGFQTAGFSEYQLLQLRDGPGSRNLPFRGFPADARSLLGRTVPGRWILTNILYRGHFHVIKWIGLQSRGGHATNEAFLDWLAGGGRIVPSSLSSTFRCPRAYIPPPGFVGRFGIRPRPPRDYSFLLGNIPVDNNPTLKRDAEMARDCYDDCIAFLDYELGRLLNALRGQGLLDNTVIIITSDHGEAFGDHGLFGHSSSLYFDAIGVPLVILARVPRRAKWWRVLSACTTCLRPWSTCWGFRQAHRSRAARWRLTGDRHNDRCPREVPPQHSQNVPTPSRSSERFKAATLTAGFRCPWWHGAIITFGMARGPRCFTISREIRLSWSISLALHMATKPWENSAGCFSRC